MSHRALIARERANGPFDLYESREAGFAIRPELARLDVDDAGLRPLASDLSFEEALGRVDAVGHEAFYVVGERERAYRVLAFLVPTADGVIEGDRVGGAGALVAIDDLDDPEPDGYLRGWFESARDCVGEAVDRGLLGECEAVPELRDRLVRFAGGDVEVIVLPLA